MLHVISGEAVCNASGMGFNGFTNDGRSKWDQMSNVDIIRFEVKIIKVIFCFVQKSLLFCLESVCLASIP